MSLDDDPFGMFGGDDDDNDSDAFDTTPQSLLLHSQTLVDQANKQLRNHSDDQATYENGTTETTPTASSQPVDSSDAAPDTEDINTSDWISRSGSKSDCDNETFVLPWRKPRYLGSINLVGEMDTIGGGRGYVATQDLSPGTLVMLEEPMLTWPDEQLGQELGLVSVRHVIESLDPIALHELEYLHPTRAAADGRQGEGLPAKDNDKNSYKQQVTQMLEDLNTRHKDDPMLQEIVNMASSRGLRNSDESSVSEIDCLRLLLVLRYNGLESGIYLHVAMLNHSDQPHCVKFMPTPSENDNDCSEVRTTRPILRGQMLTINYLPSILSHATRRHDLWEHHRFDIGVDSLTPMLRKMELVQGSLPVSSLQRWNDDSLTRQVEKSIAELRRLYEEAASATEQHHHHHLHDVLPDSDHAFIQHIRALELTSQELVTSAEEKLHNKHHVLLIPCLELHLDCADQVLRLDRSLLAKQRMLLLRRMVASALRLLQLQEWFHGPDHFDLARTNFDLAQAIQMLLSKSPSLLLQWQQEEVSTVTNLRSVAAWSSREHQARKEYQRIKGLYPRDTANFLSRKTK